MVIIYFYLNNIFKKVIITKLYPRPIFCQKIMVNRKLLFRDWTFSSFYFSYNSYESTHWYDSDYVSDISFDRTTSPLIWFFISKLIIKKSFVCRRGWSNQLLVRIIIKYDSKEVGAWSFRMIQLPVELEPLGWIQLVSRINDFENHKKEWKLFYIIFFFSKWKLIRFDI